MRTAGPPVCCCPCVLGQTRVYLSQAGLCFLEAYKLPRKFHHGQIFTSPSVVSVLLPALCLSDTLDLPLLVYVSGWPSSQCLLEPCI